MQGRAFFADRLTSGEVALPSGEVRRLRALDTVYVFPGACGWVGVVVGNEQLVTSCCLQYKRLAWRVAGQQHFDSQLTLFMPVPGAIKQAWPWAS